MVAGRRQTTTTVIMKSHIDSVGDENDSNDWILLELIIVPLPSSLFVLFRNHWPLPGMEPLPIPFRTCHANT